MVIAHFLHLALIALAIGIITLVVEKWPRKTFRKKRNLHDSIWVVR